MDAVSITGAQAGRTRDNEGTWKSARYRHGGTRARWTRGLFAVVAAANGLGVVVVLQGIGLVGRASQGDLPTRDEWLGFSTTADGLGAWIMLLNLCLAIAFLAWLSRTVDITPALGAGTPRFGPRWAIAWWFVPVAFLFMPFVVVRDLWERLATTTRRGRVGLLVAWWLTFLGGLVLGRAATAFIDRAASLEDLNSALVIAAASSALVCAAAVLGYLVVTDLQRRADELAVALELLPAPSAFVAPPATPAVPRVPSAAAPLGSVLAKFCPHCGVPRPDGARFCGQCGASLAIGDAHLSEPDRVTGAAS